jgi:aminoglycoside N3'-acetyltransferase
MGPTAQHFCAAFSLGADDRWQDGKPVRSMIMQKSRHDRLISLVFRDAGDTLFVHLSFKSLGLVDGEAPKVIAAIENVIGPDGLLLMPSFNLRKDEDERAAAWDIEQCPSTAGGITEVFWQMPGTVRSNHYSHSVAARGRGAQAFTGAVSTTGPRSPWDCSPWGRTYGDESPMLEDSRCPGTKVHMLGVD